MNITNVWLQFAFESLQTLDAWKKFQTVFFSIKQALINIINAIVKSKKERWKSEEFSKKNYLSLLNKAICKKVHVDISLYLTKTLLGWVKFRISKGLTSC